MYKNIPNQKIKYLGFPIDSVKMIITLTENKRQNLKCLILQLLRIERPSIIFLAKVLGTTISYMPGSKLGLLFYWGLENDKTVIANATANFSVETAQELQCQKIR